MVLYRMHGVGRGGGGSTRVSRRVSARRENRGNVLLGAGKLVIDCSVRDGPMHVSSVLRPLLFVLKIPRHSFDISSRASQTIRLAVWSVEARDPTT